MKRNVSLVIACVVTCWAIILMQMSGCIAPAGAAEFNFRASHSYDVSHPTHKSFVHYAELVEKESKGRIKITVIPAGALGQLDEMLNQMKFGALEINPINPTTMAKANQKFMFDELPYLYPDMDTAIRAMRGDLGKIIGALMYEDGVKMLNFTLPIGFRNMTNNVRPIEKPEDLKGLKIRVAESRIRIEAFKLLGISPTPMPFGELYSALKLKTVDGQENPLSMIYASRFYEVQKYLSLTRHLFNSGGLGFSRVVWDKLPKDVQELLQRCATESEPFDLAAIGAAESEALGLLKGKGMIVNEVDTTPFRKMLKPVYSNWAPTFGPEIVSAIKKYTGAEF